MLANQLQPLRQRNGPLPAPPTDEIVGGAQVEVGEPGDAAGAQPGTQGPSPDRGGGVGEHRGVEPLLTASCAFGYAVLRVSVRRSPGEQVACDGVERLAVVA